MVSVTGYKLNYKLDEPIVISFHTFYYRENILVKLQYNDIQGSGEASPFKPITGDSQEDVLHELRNIQSLPLNPEKDTIETLHAYMEQHISSLTLRAAIDFAYHDLLGKIKGIPAYKLYTETPHLINNSVTVFIKENPEDTAQDAERVFQQYPDLKILKIKLKGENDTARVEAIRKVAPAHMQFIVDANQGFTDPHNAVETLNKVGTILQKVILVEEPCPKGELEKLKFVTDNVQGMLVFADESAAVYADAVKVAEQKAAHGINIKLEKAGGIWPARQIALLCEKNNMKSMIGCMLEGPLGISAGVHCAISSPSVILTDLDGDLIMPEHTKGQPTFTNGQRVPTSELGLGVTFLQDKMDALIQSKDVLYEKIV